MLPKTIDLLNVGNVEIGFISIAQSYDNIPFIVKRVYWTYSTPSNVSRGHHAHKLLKQVLIAVSGEILISLEDKSGLKSEFNLNNPNQGLFIPPGYWREIHFTSDAILLCLASEKYDESEYIRDYNKFKSSLT